MDRYMATCPQFSCITNRALRHLGIRLSPRTLSLDQSWRGVLINHDIAELPSPPMGRPTTPWRMLLSDNDSLIVQAEGS